MKNILVMNDEAHHCYRKKSGGDGEGILKGDEKKEAEKNKEAARLWISGLEAEFCRVAEAHPRVLSYVKNRNLGLEVPYRYASETRRVRPDFIVQVDEGRGAQDPLHLIVEIKGYRGEDAKEKKAAMDTYRVPGVNNLKQYGRWAFAEFTEVFQIEADFKEKVEAEFNAMIAKITASHEDKNAMEA